MPCLVSCSLSLIFLIGMVYFYLMTYRNNIVQKYKSSLSPELQARYHKIKEERMKISCQGYGLGLVLALFVILTLRRKMNTLGLVCTVVAVSFVTNYFYYTLSPKSDWMLPHMNSKEEVNAWLMMYREMQVQYHAGLVLGILALAMWTLGIRDL